MRRKKLATILEDGADLTAMQRSFCEAYVADPSNGAAAARTAGATPTNSDVTASKWLSMAKVQTYIAELRTRAIEKEPEAVADLSEALAGATTVMRTELKDYKAAKDFKERDYRGAIKAAEVLVKHYDAIEAPKGLGAGTINLLQAFVNLDAQTVEAIRAATVKALPAGAIE